MKAITAKTLSGLMGVLLVAGFGSVAVAFSHTWEVWEVFSNADGTVQFVELKETHGGQDENGLSGHTMISHPSGNSSSMHNATGNTAFTYYLLGTAAFAALPGAPTPDTIIPSNFIVLGTDTSMEYSFANTGSWALGALPTDGIHSFTRTSSLGAMVPAVNSPQNNAGVLGSVDASGGPLPGVPDGTTGAPLRANRLAADGSSVQLTWDTATCTDANDHQILYGQRSGFPALYGGTYTLQGGTCNIGSTSPFTWTPTPSAADGSGLTWFLLVTKGASGNEGPWGTFNRVNERDGPGTGGSSNQCATTGKNLAGTCGH